MGLGIPALLAGTDGPGCSPGPSVLPSTWLANESLREPSGPDETDATPTEETTTGRQNAVHVTSFDGGDQLLSVKRIA